MEPHPSSIPLNSGIGPGTIRTGNGMQEMPESGPPFSVRVLTVLKAEPDRTFHVRDVAEKTGGKSDTINRILSRLSKTGKGSGPVRKISHGFYKYDPVKEQGNLMDFTGSGNWKIENMVFVRMEARSISGQGQNTGSDDQNKAPPLDISGQETGTLRTQPDPRIPTPRAGYPIILPTGQQVSWEQHDNNGTDIIRISANGAPPLSPDSVLLLIIHLGIDDTWKCVSLELNVDSHKHWINASYSLQIVKGLLLKAYQHRYCTRVEIADRREVSVREVFDLFHAIAGGIEDRQALRKTEALEARIKQNEKDTRLSLNIARQVRDREPQCKRTEQAPKKKDSPATFTTAKGLMQEQAPAAGAQEPM